MIIQRSFKVLIESKVDAAANTQQLVKHARSFTNESQKILRIQPDAIFSNVTYEEICNSVSHMFAEYEDEMKALVEDYVEYCNDSDLFDQSRNFMRVVPCGESIDINNKHAIYFQPSDRGYTKHSYLGIYANKKIHSLWKLDSVFDVKYDGKKLEKVLIKGRDTNEYDQRIISIIDDAKGECGYKIEHGHRFFCGTKPSFTDYRKKTPGGIQGARFINLKEVIGTFNDADDIAKKLSGKEWE